MSFLSLFSHRKRSESVVLLDIGADSVAGAYARYTEGETPVLLHTRRLAIEVRRAESPEEAMLRSLEILGNTLIREGAPILTRATGSGSASTVVVSVNAPWQETATRIERLEEKDSFIFTKEMVINLLKKTSVIPPEKSLADECVVGTLLNGYKTRNPYGKKAYRASIVFLTSFIDTSIVEGVVSTLRSVYHTKQVHLIAGSSLRYQALRTAFPHERDALIIDAMGSLTSIALLRKDHFAASIEVPGSDTKKSDVWIQKIIDQFDKIAKQYPLPRMIFLLAQEPRITSLRASLDAADLGKFWLSDNPPKTVSVLMSHLSGFVQQATSETPDLSLTFMALYWQHRSSIE